MIMNSQGSSTVTTVGDVQENQISIDQKNLEHVITILSSNLYSHPEQSFLREIVSNAIDAQVEAKSEEPAIISMVYDSSSCSFVIAIRDYGTGISPERFKEIYLYIGSSTKRETNDYIGSFGIGKFAPLACVDMVHVTSYYEGTQYNYLMLKNGSKINVDLISTQPTKEHNGVEVKIKVDYLWQYAEALKYLWFIPNVYVHTENYRFDESIRKINKFNDRKLYRFENFAYNNTGEDAYFVLLGNILYPVDTKYIPTEYNGGDNLRHIWQRIIPQFNIGDLDITPNREQLLYSDKTIKALEEKFKAVANELADICAELSKRTFTSLFDYYNEVTSNYITIFLPNGDGEILSLTLTKDCFLRKYIQYTYKNDPMADDEDVRKTLANLRYKTVTNVFSNAYVFAEGKYLTQRAMYKSRWECKGLLDEHTDLRLFFVPTMEGAKSDIFKSYLQEKAHAIEAKGKRAVFLLTTDTPSVRKLINNASFSVKNGPWTDVHKTIWLLRELKNSMNGHIFVYDIARSKAFLDYRKEILEQRKEERKNSGIKFNQTIRFYVDGCAKETWNSFHNQKVDVKDIPSLLDKVHSICKQLNKDVLPVYWGVSDDPYLDIWKRLITSKQVFMVVTVAKTNAKYLERAELPKNWYKVDAEFILNSREFRRWMTCNDKQVYGNELNIEILRKTSDGRFYPSLAKVKGYSCTNLNNINDPAALEYLKRQFKGYYDQTMLEGYDLLKKYNNVVEEMKGILDLNGYEVTPLSMYAAMKRKIVRPSWEEYQKITRAFNPKTEETDEENN